MNQEIFSNKSPLQQKKRLFKKSDTMIGKKLVTYPAVIV